MMMLHFNRKSVSQFVSNNLDFDYDSNQPNLKEGTSVTSSIEPSTLNTHNKEDDFIIYSSTSNRPSMSTPKVTSDSNMITTQVTESTEIARKPPKNESNSTQDSVKNVPDSKESNVEPMVTPKAENSVPTQQSVESAPVHEQTSVEISVTKGQVPVTTEESMKNVPESEGSTVEPMVRTKSEESVPTQESAESVPVNQYEESSVEPSVTKGQVPVSTEESSRTSTTDSEHEKNPPIDQMESTRGIEATNAPVTTIIEDKEEGSTTKPPNSATSSCFNINPSLINETTEQSRKKSCFPDLILTEIYNDNVTDSATGFEAPTENKQETTTIRLCGSCDNLNDVNNNKPIETEEHVVDDNQSTTNIEDTILSTSTESSIQLEFTTIMDPMPSVTEMPSVPVETTTIIQEATQPSTSEMNQPIEMTTVISQSNDFEMTSQSDPNGSSAAIGTTTTIIDENIPPKMNESKETTTIISQTTADPEMTSQHDLNSNASILTSYHLLKHLIVLCVIKIVQQS